MRNSQRNGTSEVTLDDLGGMIARGFDRVDKRIDGVEGRIDTLEVKMDAGFSSLQNQLDSARIDYVPRREHGLLADRVKKVERKVGIPVK